MSSDLLQFRLHLADLDADVVDLLADLVDALGQRLAHHFEPRADGLDGAVQRLGGGAQRGRGRRPPPHAHREAGDAAHREHDAARAAAALADDDRLWPLVEALEDLLRRARVVVRFREEAL